MESSVCGKSCGECFHVTGNIFVLRKTIQEANRKNKEAVRFKNFHRLCTSQYLLFIWNGCDLCVFNSVKTKEIRAFQTKNLPNFLLIAQQLSIIFHFGRKFFVHLFSCLLPCFILLIACSSCSSACGQKFSTKESVCVGVEKSGKLHGDTVPLTLKLQSVQLKL